MKYFALRFESRIEAQLFELNFKKELLYNILLF